MYTYESIIPQQQASEHMQCNAQKATNNDEGLYLPNFNQFCYPQTPQPGCKIPE